jgi:hypothetical protein
MFLFPFTIPVEIILFKGQKTVAEIEVYKSEGNYYLLTCIYIID